jgi:predicted  nucleic acid-binding Zn-ribbon protein
MADVERLNKELEKAREAIDAINKELAKKAEFIKGIEQEKSDLLMAGVRLQGAVATLEKLIGEEETKTDLPVDEVAEEAAE